MTASYIPSSARIASSIGEQKRFETAGALPRINRVTHLAGAASHTDLLMIGPKFEHQKSTEDVAPTPSVVRVRLLLAAWGVAAFLTFFSWNVVKQVLSWISPYIGSSSLITQYVGHVRIYTQDQPVGGGSLIDVGQPWRATIRRRMVAEFVAMAKRNYGRWYLLGDSQGSVLAFNAIQETEWCLPNYLNRTSIKAIDKLEALGCGFAPRQLWCAALHRKRDPGNCQWPSSPTSFRA